MAEAENHLSVSSTYSEVKFEEEELVKLVKQSNRIFKQLLSKKSISSEEYKYFTYDFQKPTNLGKMHSLPKIHKKHENFPGRLVISNCGTRTRKVSECLYHRLKPLIKSAKSYVKDTSDFLRKIKKLGKVPDGDILATTDVVGIYPRISHEDGLDALSEKLEIFQDKRIAKEYLLKSAEFILKNSFSEFN